MEVYLISPEMICIEESIGSVIKNACALEWLVRTLEKNLFPEVCRDNLKNRMPAVHFYGTYLHDRAVFMSEFPFITKEL